MRKRAQSSYLASNKTIQQLTAQLQQKTRQNYLLQSKYQSSQKQKNILKQGNSTLVNKFLFNNQDCQNINRLKTLLAEKEKQNNELLWKLKQVYAILLPEERNISQNLKQNNKNGFLKEEKPLSSSSKHQTSYKISVNNITKDFDLKNAVLELKQKYYVQRNKNIILEEENFNFGQQIQILQNQITKIKNQVQKQTKNQQNEQLKSSLLNLQQTLKNNQLHIKSLKTQLDQKQSQFKQKQHELQTIIKQQSQKISQLNKQIANKTTTCQNSRLSSENKYKELKQVKQETNMKDSKIYTEKQDKLSISMCKTQDLKFFSFNQSCIESDIAAEHFTNNAKDLQKKLIKLQKTNIALDKDYKVSQQKVKTMNRQYSKLKLDFLKLTQQSTRKQQTHLKKIQLLTSKLQSSNKKLKQLENKILQIERQKHSQKQVFKDIIVQLQAKSQQTQKILMKEEKQQNRLKQQLRVLQIKLSESNDLSKQLQFQRAKTKNLQKQIQNKAKQFQKQFDDYSASVQNYKNIQASYTNNDSSYSLKSRQKRQLSVEKRSQILNSSRLTSTKPQLHISLQSQTIIKTLTKQLSILKQSLNLQNQRYNILENSNKQLRKQLLKMIDQEEKLRKDLINQRIKSRTNSVSSSKNSRTFSSRKFLLQKSLQQSSNERNIVATTQRSGSIKKFQPMKLQQLHTERSSQSIGLKNSRTNNIQETTKNTKIQQVKNQSKTSNNNKQELGIQGSYLKSLRQKRFGGGGGPPLIISKNESQPTKQNSTTITKTPPPSSVSNNYQQLSFIPYANPALYKTPKTSNYSTNYLNTLPMVQSYTTQKQSQSQDHQTTQNQNNKQITLELSQSKSNLSKRQNIIEIQNQMTNNNSIEEGRKYYKEIKQPRSASKIAFKSTQMKQENQGTATVSKNILVTKDQVTKSIGDVRFTRRQKSQRSQQKKYARK